MEGGEKVGVRKLTREDVEKRLAEYMPGWSIRESDWEPKNADDKVPLLCPAGHSVDRKVVKIKLSQGCPRCNEEAVRAENAREFIAALHAENYTPLFSEGDYVNNRQKLPTRCPNGSLYEVTKNRFINEGNRCTCRDCRKQNRPSKYKRRTPEDAIRELWERGEEILGEYVDTQTQVLSRCRACGFERKIKPANYLTERASCARCSGRYRCSTDEYREEVAKSRPGWSLAPTAEYVNAHTAIDHVCNRGHVVRMRPHAFRIGAGCRVCAALANGERCRGENSNFYNDDLTEEERVEIIKARRSAEYYEWKRQVHANHNYECAICGSDEEIRAHHLYGFSYYEELMTDVENGVTLCARHHDTAFEGAFHNIYGTRNNDARQFLEFIDRYVEDADAQRLLSLREKVLRLIDRVEGTENSLAG